MEKMFQTFPNQLLYNHATSSKFCIFLLTMPQLLGCRPQACREGEGVSRHIQAHPSIGEGLITHPRIEAIEHKKPWSLHGRMKGPLWCDGKGYCCDVFRMFSGCKGQPLRVQMIHSHQILLTARPFYFWQQL